MAPQCFGFNIESTCTAGVRVASNAVTSVEAYEVCAGAAVDTRTARTLVGVR